MFIMLKQRVITAAILIPIFVWLLFYLPPKGFSLLTGLIVFWAATEWSLLMGITTTWRRLIFPVLMLAGLIVCYFYPASFYMIYLALPWWISMTFLVICYPKGRLMWSNSIVLRGVMGFFVLIPCWLALNYMRYAPSGSYILLYLFIMVWGADVGAYFTGKKWGRHKLLPLVSPGKSWEGLIGALITTLVLSLIVLLGYQFPLTSLPSIVLISMITILFSVVGDLFESMLKRNAGLKDSGTLLPGHGGILDRIDSLTAAAPIFVIGLIIISL
jgi:phosphatidate cytidylyltransferase